MEAMVGRCDFGRDLAMAHPLQAILRDPDLRRSAPSPEVQAKVIVDFWEYVTALTADRPAHPMRTARAGLRRDS
jgi:hypothetical protein